MKIDESKIPFCGFPNCPNRRAAVKRRGQNSPLYMIDQSKRSSWCRYHLRGKGIEERKAYVIAQEKK